MEIAEGLPTVLAQGLFAKAGRYPVVMRFSTLPGDILDDSVSTPRGLAVKIIGVDGARLNGSEGDVTQDLVLVNGPAFGAPNAKAFLANLKLLAATTDKIEGVKKVMSAAMRGMQQLVEVTTGQENATIATLGGQPETHILGETFYSQVPLLYGDYIAKIAIAPATPELKALTKAPLQVNGVPNALREAVVEFFRQNGGCVGSSGAALHRLARHADRKRRQGLGRGQEPVHSCGDHPGSTADGLERGAFRCDRRWYVVQPVARPCGASAARLDHARAQTGLRNGQALQGGA